MIGSPPPSIVSVSSGLGSAFAWKLKCDEFGADNVWGVFTDVNGEHPDNYRFLAETQYRLGSRLVKITNDGRTIWDVMIEERFLANTRVDICSRVLKRDAFLGWLMENCNPAQTTISLGVDFTEIHRLDRARPRWAADGWTIDAPLCEPPYLHKSEAQAWLDAEGIKRPALYDMGFSHANCGGGCVKAGIGQFKALLFADRWWYVHWWEAGEERVRRFLGRDDIAILRDRSIKGILRHLGLRASDVGERQVFVGLDDFGEVRTATERFVKSTGDVLPSLVPLPLRKLRESVEGGDVLNLFGNDPDEAQGCGVCFLEPDDEGTKVLIA